MEDSNDFSDFQPTNKSFRVFRSKRKDVLRDKLAKTHNLSQAEDSNVLQSHARRRRKRGILQDEKSTASPPSASASASADTRRKLRNKSKPPQANKAKESRKSEVCQISQASCTDKALAYDNDNNEKGSDSDVTVLHQNPMRPETKEQRSATPNSTSKNQTILNSYFDIKSTPTTPVGKLNNSSGRKSARTRRASQSKSARAKRRLLTEESKVPKSRLGRKKRGGLQSQTSRRKKLIQTCVIDDNDSDVLCIGDVEKSDSDILCIGDVEKSDSDILCIEEFEKTESSSIRSPAFNEEVCPGSVGSQNFQLDRSEEDGVFTGVNAGRSKINCAVDELFSDEMDAEADEVLPLDRSEEDVFTGVNAGSSKINCAVDELFSDEMDAETDEVLPLDRSEEDLFTDVNAGSSKINCPVEERFSDEMDAEADEVLPLDKSEEDLFTSSLTSLSKIDAFGDTCNLYRDGELGSCTVSLHDIEDEEDGFTGNMASSKHSEKESQEDIFLDLEDITMINCSVKKCSQKETTSSLEDNTDQNQDAFRRDNLTNVENNAADAEGVSQNDFTPPGGDIFSPEEDESDDEFFAALDMLEDNSNGKAIESSASFVSSTLQCGQQPSSRTSGLLSTLSNLSSQFPLFSGRSTPSVPDSETVDSTGKSQICSSVDQNASYKGNSNVSNSKQTSISSFFKTKFSVSSNGVPASVAAGTRSKSVTAPKAPRQAKGESSHSQSQSNTYQSDSSGTSNNFDHLQVYSNSKRSCPFYKRIPGTGFTVDAFRYGTIPDCAGYFLTHFHYDHYGGLAKKFSKQIYCNQITCNLVRMKIGVAAKFITVLPMNEPCDVQGVRVTLLDANHCPGAAMFLFQLRNGQTILHVGDFRASEAMESYPALVGTKVHQLYLDTTYCDPTYTFPPQYETIALAVNIVLEAIVDDPDTLFVCGTYTIGKEKIFLAIADALGCKVCVNKDKKAILECLEDQHIKDILTLQWEETKVHVLPMGQLNANSLEEHLKRFKGKYAKVIAFEPTGWTHSKQKKTSNKVQPKFKNDSVKIYGIPYSEHSSYLEMKRFVQFVRPMRILPTVNNGSAKSRQKMTAIFDEWMHEN